MYLALFRLFLSFANIFSNYKNVILIIEYKFEAYKTVKCIYNLNIILF